MHFSYFVSPGVKMGRQVLDQVELDSLAILATRNNLAECLEQYVQMVKLLRLDVIICSVFFFL